MQKNDVVKLLDENGSDRIDWKKAYFKQQAEFAALIGCPSHPNDIAAAIQDLKRRAAITDKELVARREMIKNTLREALAGIPGVTSDKVELVADSIDQIARDVTGEL